MKKILKIFVAGPFTGHLEDETNLLEKEYKETLEGIIEFIEKKGHKVFNAHRREKYGKDLYDPKKCTKQDFEDLKKSDLIIAYPGATIMSGGVHVELGWASALEKPIVLLLREGGEYSPLVLGLLSIADVDTIHFKKNEEIFTALEGYV